VITLVGYHCVQQIPDPNDFFQKNKYFVEKQKKSTKSFYLKIRSLSLSSVMMFALKLTQQNEKNEKTKKTKKQENKKLN
jgi:hypothetical protein